MANIDLSKLPPALQAALFKASQQSGQQPTTGMGESLPMTAPDPAAQAGYHPAMDQIAQAMGIGGQQQPQQAPPAPTQQAPVLANYDPSKPTFNPNSNPGFIDKYLNFMSMGMYNKAQQRSTENYYDVLKNIPGAAGLVSANTPTTPDGKPFVSLDKFKELTQIASMKAAMPQQAKPNQYMTSAEAQAAGMPKAIADQLEAAGKAKGLPGIDSMATDLFKSTRTADAGADRESEKKWQNFVKVMDASMGSRSENARDLNRLKSSERLFTLFDGTQGNPNQLQTPEMARSALSLIANGQGGQVGEQELEKFIPKSFKGTVMDYASYLLNRPFGRDQQDFTKSIYDTSMRERNTIMKQIGRSTMQAAAEHQSAIENFPDRARDVLTRKGLPPQIVDQVMKGDYSTKAFDINPPTWDEIVSGKANTQGSIGGGTAPQVDLSSSVGIRNAYQAGKLTRQQASALLKGMGSK